MTSICPSCTECKKVSVKVGPVSERFPLPIWRFECKKCGHSWTVNENSPDDHSASPSTH